MANEFEPVPGRVAQRADYRKLWWADHWNGFLSNIDPWSVSRTQRGGTYARGGRVVGLAIFGTDIEARVQGSEPYPYDVTLVWEAWRERTWDRVLEALTIRRDLIARMLGGELPLDVVDVLAAHGVVLFPVQATDVVGECSCYDWSLVCKHIAAVWYMLGECVAADPLLLFELRGWSRQDLIEAIPAFAPYADEDDDDSTALLPPEPALDAFGLTADTDANAFWTRRPAPALPLDRFDPPAVQAQAVRDLGAPGFWHGGAKDFVRTMDRAYAAATANALRLAGFGHLPEGNGNGNAEGRGRARKSTE